METDAKFEEIWQNVIDKYATIAYVKGIKQLCKECYIAGVSSSQEVITDVDESSFNQWWNIYDKKRGRDRCLTKWKRMTYEQKKACICATPAYVAATPDKQYRKDPYTYLNQKAWNDEIIKRNDGAINKEQQRQQRLRDSADLFAKYAGADTGNEV